MDIFFGPGVFTTQAVWCKISSKIKIGALTFTHKNDEMWVIVDYILFAH